MVVSLTPNNNLGSGPELAIANCANQETNLLAVWPPAIITQILGKVGFGTSGVGYNPCLVTPVAATTWGKVKTLYNN
jgi:hypothetical protein